MSDAELKRQMVELTIFDHVWVGHTDSGARTERRRGSVLCLLGRTGLEHVDEPG